MQDNEKYRLDSEFFDKKFLKAYQKIKSINNTTIEKELKVLTDFHSNGSYETISQNFKLLDEKDYAYMVRTTDLETNNFFENVKYISKSTYDFLSKSKVFGQEVLINKIGSPGRTYIMPKLDMPVSLGMNLFLLRLKGENIDENTLYLFLNSKIGKNIIQRKINGTVPLTIDKKAIKSLYVPIFSHEFRSKLNNLMFIVNKKSKNAKTLYTQAENLLISKLGLENFNPSSEKVSIKTLKESFIKTGRLDSEYYQPKYDDYLKKVFSYYNGYELLGECCNIKDKNFMPKDDEEYRYIELANVRNNAQISDCDVLIGKELPTRARRKVNTGDVIVSNIEGSLESCALITEEHNDSLCSTGFYVVSSEKINSESLLTVFKSSLILNLMKKGCSGTILTNIAKEEFAKLPIPLLKQDVQDEIASYINQSMEYSKKAKELLNISIEAVEIAIDKDEETAQKFLRQQTNKQTLIAYYNEQASYYINLAIFTLYEEIGLLDILKFANSANYTIKNLKDTFTINGRLDSEYYQEKYDRLFEKLSKNNCDKLSNLVTIKKSIEPGSESYQTKGTPFIRVQDLTKFGLTDTSIYLSESEFKDYIRPNKNTILLSKDGTVGIAYKMNKDKNIITSSAILHLDVKNKRVLPDYLTLVLNSVAVKMQAEKDAGGSIINHWKKSEVENVIIPIITRENQEQISKLLIESENLRSESKSILEKAIKSVEMAIEFGEDKAIAYLNNAIS